MEQLFAPFGRTRTRDAIVRTSGKGVTMPALYYIGVTVGFCIIMIIVRLLIGRIKHELMCLILFAVVAAAGFNALLYHADGASAYIGFCIGWTLVIMWKASQDWLREKQARERAEEARRLQERAGY